MGTMVRIEIDDKYLAAVSELSMSANEGRSAYISAICEHDLCMSTAHYRAAEHGPVVVMVERWILALNARTTTNKDRGRFISAKFEEIWFIFIRLFNVQHNSCAIIKS